jgi:hypothetical protein
VSGRTERVNARDLLNRADLILFESDAVAGWVDQLAKRAKGTLDAAKKNKIIEKEWKGDREELAKVYKALHAAHVELKKVVAHAVKQRESR